MVDVRVLGPAGGLLIEIASGGFRIVLDAPFNPMPLLQFAPADVVAGSSSSQMHSHIHPRVAPLAGTMTRSDSSKSEMSAANKPGPSPPTATGTVTIGAPTTTATSTAAAVQPSAIPSSIRRSGGVSANTESSSPGAADVASGADIASQATGSLRLVGRPRVALPSLSGLTDIETVDAILLSEARAASGLPSLLAGSLSTTQKPFLGRILASEPTVQIARRLWEDRVSLLSEYPAMPSSMATGSNTDDDETWRMAVKARGATIAALSPEWKSAVANMESWRRIYSAVDVHRVVQRIEGASFGQRVSLVGGALTVTPFSSGFSLGSTNWLVETADCRIVLIARTTLHPGLPSRHPREIQVDMLEGADFLIFADSTCSTAMTAHAVHPVPRPLPTLAHSDSSVATDNAGVSKLRGPLDEICHSIVRTVADRGNVLVPCTLEGVTLDLLEALRESLAQRGLSGVPVFVVGPSSEFLVSYCNIAGEWASAERQAKTYIPENPFPFEDWLASGGLACAPNVAALRTIAMPNAETNLATSTENRQLLWREPCVVFAADPTLRAGPALHFLRQWGEHAKNLLILSDPEVHADAFAVRCVLDPFVSTDFVMRVLHRPLDLSLGESDVQELIQLANPQRAIVRLIAEAVHTDQRADSRVPVHYLTQTVGSAARLSTDSSYHIAELLPRLATNLRPTVLGQQGAQVTVADVVAVLRAPSVQSSEPAWQIDEPRTGIERAAVRLAGMRRPVWGQTTVASVVEALQGAGINDATVVKSEAHELACILVPSLDATITLIDESHTEIEADSDELRERLFAAVSVALKSSQV